MNWNVGIIKKRLNHDSTILLQDQDIQNERAAFLAALNTFNNELNPCFPNLFLTLTRPIKPQAKKRALIFLGRLSTDKITLRSQ